MTPRLLIVACLSPALLTVDLSARAPQSLDPPKNALEHKAGPAWVEAPQPERNPWADKGIPSKHVFERVIDLVVSGRIDPRSLITHTFPFEELSEAILAASGGEGVIKVQIERSS